MRILLVLTKNNYPRPEPDVNSFGQGIPYLTGALKAAGHEVIGLNMNNLWCNGSAPLTLERLLKEAIEKYRPGLIGVGGLAPDYLFIRDVIFFSRKIAPEIPIVIGGGIATFDSEYIFTKLKPDFGVVGEGEVAIVSLVQYLKKGGDINSVPSLIHWKDGKIVFNKVQYPENLDELAFPDYEPFDFDTYLSLNNNMNNYLAHTRQFPRIMPISMGRSCPFSCTFCCHHASGKAKYRARSLDNVLKEIAFFYEKYRFNVLYVHDELFSVKNKKAMEFCAGIKALKKELNADFDWGCYLKVNDVDKEILKELKDSGCVHIGYGFESASDTVLKSMKKGTTTSAILNAIKLTTEAGVGFHANFIFGDPAETPETIQETIEFYNKYCRDYAVYFFYITPYPGSEIFDHCISKGLIPDKELYYETVSHTKGFINITSMPDDVFQGLTEPVMSKTYNDRNAEVLSCEKTEIETCDRSAPFELRRAFYKIKSICPHCREKIEHLYPLLASSNTSVRPFFHACAKCHKILVLDVSKHFRCLKQEANPYSAYYQEKPYTDYYPFDSSKYALQAVPTPRFLEQYKVYNIIRYANGIFGVAHAAGALDLTKLSEDCIKEYLNNGMFFIEESVEEVKALIDKKLASCV